MRAKKKVAPRTPQARIVQDTRDARLDRFMPLDEARKLYTEGKLAKLIGIGECFGESYERIEK